MTTVRAQFDGKALVPVDPVDLQTGRVYEVDVRDPDAPRPGSSRAIDLLLDSLPKLPAEDIDAMERAIEEGSMPARYDNIFGDESVD